MTVVTSAADIRFVAKGSGYYFASWRQVYVLDWRDGVTRESLDASVRGKAIVLRDYPKGVFVLNLMRTVAMPSAEIRAYAEKKQSEDVAGVLGHVTVIDAHGFMASAMRSTIAGLYLVARSPFPRKVYATPDEAVKWIASVASEPAAWSEQLAVAIREIRESV